MQAAISNFTPSREAAETADPFDTSIKHLLEKVFNDTNHDGPVALAFKEAGITEVNEFLALDKDDNLKQSVNTKHTQNTHTWPKDYFYQHSHSKHFH